MTKYYTHEETMNCSVTHEYKKHGIIYTLARLFAAKILPLKNKDPKQYFLHAIRFVNIYINNTNCNDFSYNLILPES